MAILILLSVSAVSATDIDDNSINLTATDNQEILSADEANFVQFDTDIQSQISTGHVVLSKNYTYDGASHDDTGVVISQSDVVIEGTTNCTINGNNLARIFTLTGTNITLNNINFIKADDYAVCVEGDGCKIINSNFYHNNNTHAFNNPGGAVLWKGDNGELTNCDFRNNYVNYVSDTRYDRGASIFWAGDDGVVSYCNFTDCYVSQLGAGISWGNNITVPKNGRIYKGNFKNCTTLYHVGQFPQTV